MKYTQRLQPRQRRGGSGTTAIVLERERTRKEERGKRGGKEERKERKRRKKEREGVGNVRRDEKTASGGWRKVRER